MKKYNLLISILLVLGMLLGACAQTSTPVAPAAPAQSEEPEQPVAPAQPAEPVALEKPADPAAPAEAPEVSPAETADTETKPIVVASPNDMDTFDPHYQTGMFPYRSLVYWVFDVLVNADYDGQPIPELATEWKRVDTLTWEFKLTEGATFHNGEPVNAEAVKYSFERMKDPDLINANQIFRRASLKEVVIVDEYTVQLVTEQPAPEILYWLSESFIVPPKYYSENDSTYLSMNPVGSGPFKFVEWVKDDHISFVVNENYHLGVSPIKKAVFRVIPEASSRLNELITGNVDIVTGLTPKLAEQANSDVSRLVTAEGWRKMHVGFSGDGDKIIQNKLVRQALNYAVDKQAIIDALLLGATTPLDCVVTPPLNNPDLKAYPYDPEKAKALLAEAGYPDGFEILFQTPIERYGLDKEISQIVAQYLADVGVKTKFEAIEWGGKYINLVDQKAFEGIYFMGYSTYIVPGPQLGTFICGALSNPGDYCNEEYDAMFDEWNTTEDEAKREEISYAMQAFIWEEAPWIFLWRLPMFIGISNRIDWQPHPALYVDLWDVKLQ